MDQATVFMNSLTSFLLPLAAAADTQGMYTIVPQTVQNLMKNPVVQYFVLYYFLVGGGAESQYALMFIIAMIALLYLEKSGFLSV